ncbi:MAG: CoA transferase, partial [Chloroflexi bacterium]|nr:CoA transferase [Chloroflexota bacterium]
KFWQNFCRTVGREDWLERGDWKISVDYGTDDPELEKEMNTRFKTKPLDEWIKLLGDADVPVVPGYTIDQVVHSKYAEGRGLVDSYEHAGFGPVRQVNFPVRMRGNGADKNRPAPDVGQDNEEILQSLGYDAKAIAGMKEKGVL